MTSSLVPGIYDVCIIGGGASGLFCASQLPIGIKKCILEKTDKIGTKVLLSGGQRCNCTNASINLHKDYFGQDTSLLPALFKKFSSRDMISFLQAHGLETKEEDRHRIILASGKAKHLVALLEAKARANETEIFCNQEVAAVTKEKDIFHIKTTTNTYTAHHVVLATGGKSYPQVGTTGFAYNLAKEHNIGVIPPYRGLCGIETQDYVGELTGNATPVKLQLLHNKTLIRDGMGPLLFTHRGVSGPVVFDASCALGTRQIRTGVRSDSCTLRILFDPKQTIQKILTFFHCSAKKVDVFLRIKDTRPRENATVTGGGIATEELTEHLEAKKMPGLWCVGEAVDITGRTGGFNLQWAWTSGYIAAKEIGKKIL